MILAHVLVGGKRRVVVMIRTGPQFTWVAPFSSIPPLHPRWLGGWLVVVVRDAAIAGWFDILRG